ncbi:hypothetical protein BUE80_DR008153 [Diplocarpon rosae]|nr:hypothetical protein BUE80_DR008153 [Diplocarpon rosae]
MDPFSITVGAVALTETANKLAGTLTDRYKAFSSAPQQMIEISGQITLVAGLVDVFAKSVDGTGQPFPRKFESDATSLVRQCRAILKDIDAMIPHGSSKPDYQQRLKYAFRDEQRIIKYQDRLKEVQHMFMFMTTCWMYQLAPPQTAKQPASLVTTEIPNVGFQDPHNFPMQLSLKGFGESPKGISYEATLTLRPSAQSQHESRVAFEKERLEKKKLQREAPQRQGKVKLSEAQEENLANMKRSPYFLLELLRPPVEEPARYSRTAPGYEKKMSFEIEEKKLEDANNKERRKTKVAEYRDFEPSSREEARKSVRGLLSQWFSDDVTSPDNQLYPKYSEQEGVFKYGYTTPSTQPPSEAYSLTESRPKNASVPADAASAHRVPADSARSFPLQASLSQPLRRAVDVWDWCCDGCNSKSSDTY